MTPAPDGSWASLKQLVNASEPALAARGLLDGAAIWPDLTRRLSVLVGTRDLHPDRLADIVAALKIIAADSDGAEQDVPEELRALQEATRSLRERERAELTAQGDLVRLLDAQDDLGKRVVSLRAECAALEQELKTIGELQKDGP